MWILTMKCFACPAGELDCQVCAVVRGGLIGAVVGSLYPIFMAVPVNGSLAARYVSSICCELNLVIFPALSLNGVNFQSMHTVSSWRLLLCGRWSVPVIQLQGEVPKRYASNPPNRKKKIYKTELEYCKTFEFSWEPYKLCMIYVGKLNWGSHPTKQWTFLSGVWLGI